MQILFVHGNYPGQFHWLAELLGRQAQHEVRFLTAREEARELPIPGVQVELFREPETEPAAAVASPLQQATSLAISRAAVVEERLHAMACAGFVPRLAVVHGSNGLALLIKQLLPNCLVVGYFEWFFHPDQAPDLLGRQDRLSRQLLQLRNLTTCQEIVSCDAAVVPTPWQASQFPQPLRSKLQVIFDGVDRHWHQPPADPARNWALDLVGEEASVHLEEGTPLISYATRGMEPIRGFPEFMRVLPAVLAVQPRLQVVIAGRDRSAYGPVAPSQVTPVRSISHFCTYEPLGLSAANCAELVTTSAPFSVIENPAPVVPRQLYGSVACAGDVVIDGAARATARPAVSVAAMVNSRPHGRRVRGIGTPCVVAVTTTTQF